MKIDQLEISANKIIDFIATHLAEEKKRIDNPEEIVKRSKLQVGVKSDVRLKFTSDGFLIDNTYSFASKNADKVHLDIDLAEESVILNLIPLLNEGLTDVVKLYDEDPFLSYELSIDVTLTGKDGYKKTYSLLHYVNERKKKEVYDNTEKYIDNLFNGKGYPPKELDIFFLSDLIVSPTLYPQIDNERIRRIIDQIEKLYKSNGKTFDTRHNFINKLKELVSDTFLPTYFHVKAEKWGQCNYILKEGVRVADKDLPFIDLTIYTAVLILKYEPNYARDTGITFLDKLVELGFGKAKEILKTGSGSFDKSDIYYKDENLVCEANDVFATIAINIKNESAESYSKALDFICNLLEKSFPPSYQIKLKSKAKNFLPIKKIGKSKTHLFFGNALQYTELFDKIADYVTLAIRNEYEWYQDIEDEACAMPGTYAIFGLALTDLKYIPLLIAYMQKVDSEHQGVQNYFTIEFISKYGITPQTVSPIVECLKACSDNIQILKQSSEFETEENLQTLLASIEGLEDHMVTHILFLIWGKKSNFMKKKKKADKSIAHYMEELEKLADLKYWGE